MSKVSVIVPVYNTEQFVERCLNSLVNQTLQDIEILVIDDGSTDSSFDIINKFVSQYPEKVLCLRKENGGLSDARNFALSHVHGEYLGFVDSDDYVELDMFENMYNLAKNNNLDLVECNFIWEYPDQIKYDNGFNYLTVQDYFTKGRVMMCNKIFKTEIIKNNNILFSKGLLYEDVEFFYKFISYTKKSGLISDYCYHYMQRENSIVNKQTAKTADIFVILNNILEFYKANNLYDAHKSELEYLFIRFLLGSSFLRIVKIKDKVVRRNLLNKSINELYEKFPNWRKNVLLTQNKTKKNTYYKSINHFTFRVYSFVFKYT